MQLTVNGPSKWARVLLPIGKVSRRESEGGIWREGSERGWLEATENKVYPLHSFIQSPHGPHPTQFHHFRHNQVVVDSLSLPFSSFLFFLSHTFIILRSSWARTFPGLPSFHHSWSHLSNHSLVYNWVSVSLIWGLNCAVNNTTGYWGCVWLPSQTVNGEIKEHYSIFFLHPLRF